MLWAFSACDSRPVPRIFDTVIAVSQPRTIALYGVIGIAAAILDFSTFLFARNLLLLPLLLANSMGIGVGLIFSFTLNRRYNFRVMDRPVTRFSRFASVSFAGFLLSNASIYGLTQLGVDEAVAKVMSIGCVAVFQFLLNRFWSFRA